jgi:biotin carboxylase
MRYSRATPWSEVEAFLAHPRLKPPATGPDAKCQFRCVIKPVRSSGTDGVTFCSTIEEVKAAHDKILGKTNRLGVSNESCVMQELLEGVEHIVDTVSCEGLHKTTAVWQYQKGPANGSRFVYIGMKTLPSDDPMFVPLIKYVHQAIDALGVRYGPTHAEVMFCNDGSPCLVEVGSRFQGVQGMWTDPANEAIGYNQIDAMVDLLVEPAKYWALPRLPIRLLKHARQIFVVSPVSGILESMPHLETLRALPSMRKATFYIQPGQPIAATVRLHAMFTYHDLCFVAFF